MPHTPLRSLFASCCAFASLGLLGTPAYAQQAQAQQFGVSAETDSRKLAPLPVTFRADVSAGTQVQWNFGDGSTAQGARVQHTFYRPGNYQIAVTVQRGGQVVGRGGLNMQVNSQGPERANLVVLLGQGSVQLSAEGSVMYRPYTAQFALNGRQLSGSNAALAGRNQTASVTLVGAGSASLSKSLTVPTPPSTAQRNASLETATLNEINRLRAAGYNCATGRFDGVRRPSLTRQPLLDKAALAHTLAMPTLGFVSHTSALDGSLPAQRIAASGYKAQATSENIAVGQANPAEAVQDWLASPSHCKALTDDYSQTGIAYVRVPNTAYQHYWVQVFANPMQ